MSPFERHDDSLRDLQQGGSGQGPNGGGDVEEEAREASDGRSPEDTADEELDESPEELAEELEADELEREEVKEARREQHSGPGPFRRLYRGETLFDFVGRRRVWMLISGIVIVAGLLSLGFRGLNLGIDFKGGTAWIVKSSTLTQGHVESLVTAAGLSQPTVEVLGSGGSRTIEVQGDLNSLPAAKRSTVSNDVETALAKAAHVSKTGVSITRVGPTWGGQVTQKAIEALIVFFVIVAVYISFRFEPKMALAAFIAMIHDLLVTIGVYSLTGFQVSPDTVIAILTILGYSLYDTVVVFDRVRDNTKGFGASGRMTYSEMINLSMNQTLARSINTSLVAVLPVLSVLLIGAELLGATTLQEYGLALTVGLISGAYSSIFIASPVLAMLKEHEPRYVAIRQRLQARGDRVGLLTPAAAAALAGAGAGGGSTGMGDGRSARAGAGSSRSTTTLRPGAGAASARRSSSQRRSDAVGSGSGGTGPAGQAGANSGSKAPSGAGSNAGSRGSSGARSGTPTSSRSAGAGGVGRPPPRPRKSGGKKRKRR
ncbi:MAG: protein translocase subunit SecF [Actinomycetota bacterium]|nr:protein translocase subunit SecF [Actinomycetota bacterium]